MASTEFLDARFSVSLQTLLDRPDALDAVLKHRGADGTASHTYGALCILIDRVVRLSVTPMLYQYTAHRRCAKLASAPEIVHEAISRNSGVDASDPESPGVGSNQGMEEEEGGSSKGKQASELGHLICSRVDLNAYRSLRWTWKAEQISSCPLGCLGRTRAIEGSVSLRVGLGTVNARWVRWQRSNKQLRTFWKDLIWLMWKA